MRDETPRIIKIGDAVSQFGNVIWPFWDHRETTANESVSGRCYREDRPFGRVIDLFFFWQKDPRHCERAYLSDVERAIAFKAQHRERLNGVLQREQ